jgi:hypothetical protein
MRAALLLAAMATSVLAQQSRNPYSALKDALGLSDSQLAQIDNAHYLRYQVLDESQRTRLAAIEKVLDLSEMASEAIVLGLITTEQWPGTSLCFYPIRGHSWELNLSVDQVSQFERLQQSVRDPLFRQIREKVALQQELLKAGMNSESPAVAQLESEISALSREAASARPQRDVLLALLDASQRAKLAAFEAALRVLSEAIELGLIPVPLKAEVLCS